ncbi:sigma-70 family RNA polymerase sigma factor [Paenibacillus thalictri]|uniref:Sigma-70 family RNA polymerase sigma factor n=1 Tax=Paenibacillus thalictri TaxID=2527873 RepID=A0A4Q9DKQ2_9BACL|nr:sigma-70 family RNA polymerase sigma factor [Paenibacillus thalictri]TBL75381.1 sigma-70 family RNA polymerase sigma factor [Paenibacillus thalictri]
MDVSEERLAQRLQNKDPVALEMLMEAYTSSIYQLVRRILHICGRKEDIEECVSDVFVAAWHRADEYDAGRASLRTWLLILAKYKALDYRRKLAGRAETSEVGADLKDRGNTEYEAMLKVEAEEILRIVDTLSSVDRSIFYKKYVLYESSESIARALGLTSKAVENRLRRARMAVKRRLHTNLREGLYE